MTRLNPAPRSPVCRRFKMELALSDTLPQAILPAGFCFVPWQPALLERHATVIHRAFREELDALIMPRLADADGCRTLMEEICLGPRFIPAATWLVCGPGGDCGSIQALSERPGVGAIQNLGVQPADRRLGLGHALLLQALNGLWWNGFGRAVLQVTERNKSAIRVYQALGFCRRRTVYNSPGSSSLSPHALDEPSPVY